MDIFILNTIIYTYIYSFALNYVTIMLKFTSRIEVKKLSFCS